MPPSEASAPGSIGKNSPWSRRCSFSALRVTPGWITQSRSSAWTSSIRFMSRRSMQMPPAGALTCPSSEVPVPKAITGTRVFGADPHHVLDIGGFLRHHHGVGRLRRQPGGGMGVLLAHGLRGDQPVAEPRRQRLHRACQRLRFRPLQIARYRCRHAQFLPALSRPWQRIYKGSRDPDRTTGMDDDDRCRRQG